MKLKAKKDFFDREEYLRVSKGTTIERTPQRAAVLIAAGVAAEAKNTSKSKA